MLTKFVIPLFTAMVFACAPQPGKPLQDPGVGKRSIPLLDQSIPQKLATATFALG